MELTRQASPEPATATLTPEHARLPDTALLAGRRFAPESSESGLRQCSNYCTMLCTSKDLLVLGLLGAVAPFLAVAN